MRAEVAAFACGMSAASLLVILGVPAGAIAGTVGLVAAVVLIAAWCARRDARRIERMILAAPTSYREAAVVRTPRPLDWYALRDGDDEEWKP